MTDNATGTPQGRMLLSHNFTLTEGNVPPLSRAEFAEVFSQGLSGTAGVNCQLVENPHWIVEVSYDAGQYAPTAVGELCAKALESFRQANGHNGFSIMALGGVKTTPATSPPPSLQTGEWGVDVVETVSPDAFLQAINWDALSGDKPADSIFRIDQPVG